MILRIDDGTTHEESSCQYQPQDGSGEPDSKCRRMISALPSYPNPNNVDAPMAPATQAQATRPGASPNKDEDEIDDGRCEKEERDENWQHIVQRS